MQEFKKVLIAFVKGQLDTAGVERALGDLVSRDPSLYGPYIDQLNLLYKKKHLPPQEYSRFRTAIKAARDGQTGAPAEPSAAPPAPPTGSDDDEDAGKTAFRMPPAAAPPPVAPSAPPEEDAGDKTQIRMPNQAATGRTGRTGAPTGAAWTGQHTGAATGGTGSSVYPTGASSGSTWGSPSDWTENDGGMVGAGSVIKGRFVLEEMIGKGGMGTVYKARDLRKEEAQDRFPYVALKVLNEEFKQHPDSLKALQREARKAQDLAHPNIVNVFDFDRDGGTVFMTMELLQGRPLDEFIREYRNTGIPWQEALPIIKGMSLALDYAHRKRIVHSDFKPGNCFLTKEGVVKVFDFGIARAAKLHDDHLDGEETKFDAATLGALTPAYASVEMIEGLEPDKRDDVYALACTAYELLAGAHPFNKISAADARKKNLVPKPIKGVPKWRQRALLKGLAFSREERSESAFGFLEAVNPKRNTRTLAIGGGAAAVVAVVIIALIAVPNYLAKRKIEGIRVALQSNDYAQTVAALDEVGSIDERDQRDIMNAQRTEIITTFDQQAADLFDIDNQRYQYPEARAVLDRLVAMYPDSAQVRELDTGLDAAKSEILAELARKYETYLEGGQLLPVEEEDIEDVRLVLQQVDPEDSLLSDARLPLALALQAKTAADNQDFDLAEAYLEAGFALVPDDAALVNLRDRVLSERNAIERAREISDLETVLTQALPGLQTLDDFRSVRSDLRDLEAIQPDNAVVGRVTTALRRQLDAEIGRSLIAQDWDRARQRLDEFTDVLDADYLERSAGLVADAERQHNDVIAGLVASLDDVLLDTDPAVLSEEQVGGLLGSLEGSGAPESTLSEARTRVASAYLNAATNARAAENWDLARSWVNRGLAMDSEGTVGDDLNAELSKIDNQVQLATMELANRERNALAAQFDTRLSQAQFATQDVRAAMRLLDDLNARFASDPEAMQLIEQGPDRLAERVATAARELGEREQWEDAATLLSDSSSELGNLRALAEARQMLNRQQQATQARRLSARIDEHKQALTGLLEAPALDDRWSASVSAELAELEGLAPMDPFIGTTRERVANAYLADVRRLRSEERWVKAQESLDQAVAIAPGLASVRTEKEILDASLEGYRVSLVAAQQEAEIEARKQGFSRELAARALDRAENIFNELKTRLPASDVFITRDGPQGLADGYLRSARDLAARNQFSNAIRAADKGLAFVGQHAEILASKAAFARQRDIYLAVTEGDATSISAIGSQLDDLRSQIDNYQAFENGLKVALRNRIERQAQTDTAGADALLQAARIPFAGLSAQISRPTPQPQPQPQPTQTAQTQPPTVSTSVAPETQPDSSQVAVVSPPPVASTPPPVVASVDPCGSKRPGGRRTCRDPLPGGGNGPFMVVIPGMSGGNSLAITRYEISVGDFNNYCSQSGACPTRPGDKKQPVTNVSATQIKAYLTWLGNETQRSYALPTRSEWEYAARADGSAASRKVNCFRRDSGGGQAGGFKMLPIDSNKDNGNSWGVVNVFGNASELVQNGNGYLAMGGSYKDRVSDCDLGEASQVDGSGRDEMGFRIVRRM